MSTWCEQAQRALQHIQQILDIGKILHHRVQHNGIKRSLLQAAEVVSGSSEKSHLWQGVLRLTQLVLQGSQRGRGGVGPVIGLAVRGQAQEEQSSATADL